MEIELNYSNSTRNGFHYNAGVMFGLNENRITRFNDAPYIPAYQKTVNTQYGAPRTGNTLIDDKYFNSIDELHGYPLYTKEWTNITPGIYKFLDYKPDGIIDITDLHTLDGSTYAPVTYSFNLGFSYKGLTFKTLWTALSANTSTIAEPPLFHSTRAILSCMRHILIIGVPTTTTRTSPPYRSTIKCTHGVEEHRNIRATISLCPVTHGASRII